MNFSTTQAFYQRHRTWLVLTAIVICTLLALMARRPDQFTNPYVWVEDARINLPDYANYGWGSVLHPVTGYFLIPNKIIFAVSMTLSFLWLPEISLWLTVVFTMMVLAAVAFSPTQLRLRAACALGLLCLPVDSEVYGVSAYAFWWGSILAALPLFWRKQGSQLHLPRLAMLAIGGLSSPLIIVLTPLYALRALLERRSVAYVDFGVAAVIAAIQFASLTAANLAKSDALSYAGPWMFVEKFFGYFVYVHPQLGGHEYASACVSALFLLAFVFCAWRYRAALGPVFFLLVGTFLLAGFASISRSWLIAIHPALAGPRYFFLPFAFLSWAILQFAALESRLPQLFAAIVLALAMRNALDIGQRRHDSVDWRAQIANCARGTSMQIIPFHFDGRLASMGHAELLGSDCLRLVESSWFARQIPREYATP